MGITKPGSLLKSSIPIRTFGEWEDKGPGFIEVDIVAHCGKSTEGFYLTTLSAVDIVTRWSEYMRVWDKGQNGYPLSASPCYILCSADFVPPTRSRYGTGEIATACCIRR